MSVIHRLRRRASIPSAALTGILAVALTACGHYPDSVFTNHTDFNREIGFLFDLLIWLGGFVFVFVEVLLVYTLWKYRKREGQPAPQNVHGNTTLEITWTVVPALILVIIAVPTVRTIFRTEAPAKSESLLVDVIGHQWWWEFRYPQYTVAGANGKIDTVVTANELYLPIGRTVNFRLRTNDVLHSFWVPALGGKRDLIANHTNFLWFTPDSVHENVFNGACVEYCGTSHANMRFKAYTVSQQDFDSWIEHEKQPAAVASAMPGAGAAPAATPVPPTTPGSPRTPAALPTTTPTAAAPAPVQAGFASFPEEKLPAYAIPNTPIPAGLTFDRNLLAAGDVKRGEQAFLMGGCVGCHSVRGNPVAIGIIGPNLTHYASRHTIGAGLYPKTPINLALWIKNARMMKPGIVMPTLGKGQIDPSTGQVTATGLLTDQQIADVVAYLQALK